MPISLPGLFNFTTGRTSAIQQRALGAQADSAEANAFVNQLNAFNTGLNTNDNLEFRQDFANQPQGTNILDRFSNIAQNTTNPFNLTQAIVQQQALAPLLALSGIQNPFFAQQQGLPSTPQGAIDNASFGLRPILQQQQNANIQSLLATNNPALNPNTFAQGAEQATSLALQGQAIQAVEQRAAAAEQRAQEAQRLLTESIQRISQSTATAANTASAPASTANLVPIEATPATRGPDTFAGVGPLRSF